MIGSIDYGLWSTVVLNSFIFIIFAFSFFRPRTSRDWRSFGAFSAFLIALFTEMFGIPLTIFLFSGWLQSRFPELDLLSHNSGHLWQIIFGFEGDPHLNPVHLVSNMMLLLGFIILGAAWVILHQAQTTRRLATSGIYAWIRHPQYLAFILILLAFLLMWPTLLTVVMFPVLVVMYLRLARKEEQEVRSDFGEEYERYAIKTPTFFPKWQALTSREMSVISSILLLTFFLMWWPAPLSLLTISVLVMLYKSKVKKSAEQTNIFYQEEETVLSGNEVSERDTRL